MLVMTRHAGAQRRLIWVWYARPGTSWQRATGSVEAMTIKPCSWAGLFLSGLALRAWGRRCGRDRAPLHRHDHCL